MSPTATDIPVTFRVNGASCQVPLDGELTLLDALRDHLDLTGTKKGCDQGACGACTVLLDGKRRLSCLTLAAQCEGHEVTTIEGLAHDGRLERRHRSATWPPSAETCCNGLAAATSGTGQ
jgi:xanthine dehydrogenase YagT iron-sulfur-binding subunit